MANVFATTSQAKIPLPKPGEFAPSGIPLSFDWSAAGFYDVNLLISQGQGQIGGVQSMWFYNPSAGKLTINFGGSGQTMQIPAMTQGYIPVLMPNTPSLHIVNASPDSTTTQLILLNYVLPGVFEAIT